jgi:hypothetical protein
MPRLISALAVFLTIAVATSPVQAGSSRYRPADAEGTVTAESRFGNGTVSGPVRYGRMGREVQLPGGTWEPCKRSCAETLRVSTVDFWYANGPSAIAPECGVFGCLTLRYPR